MSSGPPSKATVANIVAGTLVNYTWAWGLFYTFPIFFKHFSESFGVAGGSSENFLLSWVNSLAVFMTYGLCILVSRTVSKFGPARCALWGSIQLSVGLLLTSFAQKIWHVYITYGVICGFAMSLQGGLPQATMVSQIGGSRVGFLMGIQVSGASVGSVLLPLVVAPLISAIGWRGTCQILSGFMLVTNLMAYSVFPAHKPKPKPAALIAAAAAASSNSDFIDSAAGVLDAQEARAALRKAEKAEEDAANAQLTSSLLREPYLRQIAEEDEDETDEEDGVSSLPRTASARGASGGGYFKMSPMSPPKYAPPTIREEPSALEAAAAEEGNAGEGTAGAKPPGGASPPPPILASPAALMPPPLSASTGPAPPPPVARSMLSLLGDRQMWPLLFGFPVAMCGYWTMGIYVVPYAQQQLHFSDTEVSHVLIIIGLASFIGRLGMGYASDSLGPFVVFQIAIGMKAMLTMVWPFIRDPTWFQVYCILIGMFSGGFFGLIPKLLVEYFGRHNLPNAFGLTATFSSFGSLLGPPVAGMLYDGPGFQIGCIFPAGTLVAGGLIMMLLPQIRKQRSEAASRGKPIMW